ncbi:ABC transporter permease [Actinoalloteichus sp. GBA129-24]|uniref:ABC transporter permease n=1 Tax=Actinoalloteichus sp. GBA129-24 TaxID=1612551 RepID=UPI0009509B1F|nr:ABC transporter permease [Actinoalloteichus sp. GBA129-24]APU24102.1 permease component of ribose/xylose/arabinose/galactoside ABC-type transporters [Actinoalloteichus sp. GBA129-24]
MTSVEKTGRRSRGGFDMNKLLGENGALLGLVVLSVALWIMVPSFGSPQNLLNIGVQAAVVAVMAFGVTFVIISGGIDLSVGSVAALSAMVGAWSAADLGLPGGLALIVGLLTGVAAGLVNGLMVSFGKLPAFIATLAMLSIARGLTLVVSQGRPAATPDEISFFGSTIEAGPIQLPMPVLILVGMFLVTGFILTRTYSGRAMYAIGGNEEAARLSGISVRNQKLVVYALSGLFAAMAGMMLAGRLSSAGPQAAVGYELDAIAAVVIGGASLSGGIGRATGTLVGSLVLAVLRNGLNQLQVSPFWQQVVIGVVIALAVLVDTVRRRGK